MKNNVVLSADDLDLESLARDLGVRFEMEAPAKVRVTWLDTFDWRLHDAGQRLTSEHEGQRRSLVWRSIEQAPPYVLPIDRAAHFARELPEGFLRAQIEPVVEERALLPMGSARINRRSARVTDLLGNIVVRLLVEDVTALDRSNRAARPSTRTVSLQPLSATERDVDRLVRKLQDHGAGSPGAPDPLIEAATARGRYPGDYSSKPTHSLRPDQRSDETMRAVLGHLLETMTANVDGVMADIDIEFLHDLRVATRRARSAIGQMKNVLPKPECDHLAAELRWLGTATNACRDLDVALLELNGYRELLATEAGAVDHLERLLRRERARALRRVRSALRSRRYEELVSSWRALVTDPTPDNGTEHAERPVGDLAGAKIIRAYRRMVKRGKRLADPPPAADLHRLRIDAKKLRYLLEFFASLYPEATVARLVKELKRFQDVLGGFNDTEVQRAHLTRLAEQLMHEGKADASTMFAVGRLADDLRDRQERHRREFGERFTEFAAPASRRLYSKTFGGG